METNYILALLILMPFVGFLVNGFFYRKFDGFVSGVIATGAVFLSFLCSVSLFLRLTTLPEDARVLRAVFFDWIRVGDFLATASFVVDPISAIMILIITGVGTLIHLFSIGYMSHDARPAKYFSYLNLFVFNMLLLVLGSNLLVMFVGWEGVGLCSYLLIGFWFTDKEKAAAGMKAFITNRIGDAGFLLGIFTLFVAFGTIEFSELAARVSASTAESGWTGPITLACLFLFVGATGKSAEIPLHVWLPDAMAGPTPVSALIHAATMVTAGVYMIVRLSPVFMMAPNAMFVVAVVGALTALLGATIGMTQWDIKKVLAYSTVSQLGFMFLAVGVGAFTAGLFHLMTHAFFKALMFLGSGSVIHAMHEEQDIRKMGGLRAHMPITHATFFLGWLAIIGIPPLAGFFSKDEILWMAFHSPLGSKWLWLVAMISAICTAFYMTRLMCLTFWGKSRVSKEVHPHESPLTMTVPLMVLGLLSIVGGWLGIPHVIGASLGHIPNILELWLRAVVVSPELAHASASLELGVVVAVFVARQFYLTRPELASAVTRRIEPLYKLVSNKYWLDELYFGRVIRPLVKLSENLWLIIDRKFIDKMTFIISDVVRATGSVFRALQNGNIQQYASYILFGLVGTALIIIMQMG